MFQGVFSLAPLLWIYGSLFLIGMNDWFIDFLKLKCQAFLVFHFINYRVGGFRCEGDDDDERRRTDVLMEKSDALTTEPSR